MNYYDEEIEINRESTKETGHISKSLNLTKPISLKEEESTKSSTNEEPELSVKFNSDNDNSNNRHNKNNISNANKYDIENVNNNKMNTESSESETEEDATQNEEIQEKTYSLLTADKWKNLAISQELKDVMQNILKYVPQTIDTEYKLHPFMPDFVPSVGDVDAFLKVSCPDPLDNTKNKVIDDFMRVMGVSILDEPSGRQSDPSLLNMKMKSFFTKPGATNISTKIPVARNVKDIDKWINEMDEIHRDQSINRINSIELNDEFNIDNLMAEWPKALEAVLNENGFPPPELDCSLESYLKIVSVIFDIPIAEFNSTHYIKVIHVLFNLYLAVNDTVDFK